MTQDLTDLAKRAAGGDADAFLELIEQNSLNMYKIARSILKNDEDAADAIQDTILTCFEKIHTLRQPEYFKTWMTRILINECQKILRHSHGTVSEEQMFEASGQDMSFAEFEFRQMLEQVDEKYRAVLVLYYVQGFKISEIAKLLNLNESTVKTRLARARIQIRKAYSEPEKKKGACCDEKSGFLLF